MLFCEFQKGTGCKDNERNHKVYKDLEIMYMNSDMSKEDIYAYGRMLVDNSKSDAEIEAEEKIKEELKQNKDAINTYKRLIELEKSFAVVNKKVIKSYRGMIRYHRARVNELKWVLS